MNKLALIFGFMPTVAIAAPRGELQSLGDGGSIVSVVLIFLICAAVIVWLISDFEKFGLAAFFENLLLNVCSKCFLLLFPVLSFAHDNPSSLEESMGHLFAMVVIGGTFLALFSDKEKSHFKYKKSTQKVGPEKPVKDTDKPDIPSEPSPRKNKEKTHKVVETVKKEAVKLQWKVPSETLFDRLISGKLGLGVTAWGYGVLASLAVSGLAIIAVEYSKIAVAVILIGHFLYQFSVMQGIVFATSELRYKGTQRWRSICECSWWVALILPVVALLIRKIASLS